MLSNDVSNTNDRRAAVQRCCCEDRGRLIVAGVGFGCWSLVKHSAVWGRGGGCWLHTSENQLFVGIQQQTHTVLHSNNPPVVNTLNCSHVLMPNTHPKHAPIGHQPVASKATCAEPGMCTDTQACSCILAGGLLQITWWPGASNYVTTNGASHIHTGAARCRGL